MPAYAGYNATINAACNSGTKWTVEINTDLLDSTTFCSNGNREYVAGLTGGTFTIESLAPITITAGASLTLSNDAVTISGNALTSTATYDVSVDGLCTFVYKGNFTGAITVT